MFCCIVSAINIVHVEFQSEYNRCLGVGGRRISIPSHDLFDLIDFNQYWVDIDLLDPPHEQPSHQERKKPLLPLPLFSSLLGKELARVNFNRLINCLLIWGWDWPESIKVVTAISCTRCLMITYIMCYMSSLFWRKTKGGNNWLQANLTRVSIPLIWEPYIEQ